MLSRFNNYCLIIGLMLIGLFAALLAGRAISLISVATLFAFVTQMALLIFLSRKEEEVLTDKTMFWTILVYNLVVAAVFYAVGYHYQRDMFFLSDPDARFYYRDGLRSVDLGFFQNTKRLLNKYPFDDWGALVFSSFMMSIIPSRYFVHTFYILTGVLSSLMLHNMGRHFMPKKYSFLAALAYGTSSYLIVFHCTYLKESLFLFLVIGAVFCFYKSIIEKRHLFLAGTIICLAGTFFLRPVVTAFLLLSFVAYYAVAQRGSAVSVLLYIIAGAGLIISFAFLQGEFSRYVGTEESILAESGSSNYSGAFNFAVGWFAALFGPFPTIFPIEGHIPEPMNLYGAGLIYYAFLTIWFWVGCYFALKKWETRLFPILIFVLVETAASAMVLAGFELRKVLLHIPFKYIIAFYGIYCLEESDCNIAIKRNTELISFLFAIGVLFLWNVIRVK